VAFDANDDQISQAYFERSRLFHPDLRHREDLAHCEKELTAVFERLKTAHETLSDVRKRAEYDAEIAASPVPLAVSEAAADPNARKTLASQNVRRARQLIEQKDFHPAVEMLREAIRFVPDNADYRYTLGQVELRNSMWVARGLDNLKEAARLEPRNNQYIHDAGKALLEHGRAAEAEPFARRAVDLDPTPENRALLDAVEAGMKGIARKPVDSLDSRALVPDGPDVASGQTLTPGSDPLAPEERPNLFSRIFRRN
jgi:curved DNA-binding protein CbpA